MVYVNQQFMKQMMEHAVEDLSEEKLYLIAYQWETNVTQPPWWAFWREPIITRTEVQQPGKVECELVMGDRFPDIEVIKAGPTPWTGASKIHVVTDKGVEIAYLPTNFFEA